MTLRRLCQGEGRDKDDILNSHHHLSIMREHASHLGAAVLSSFSLCERVNLLMLSLMPCNRSASVSLVDLLSVPANGVAAVVAFDWVVAVHACSRCWPCWVSDGALSKN